MDGWDDAHPLLFLVLSDKCVCLFIFWETFLGLIFLFEYFYERRNRLYVSDAIKIYYLH